MVGLQVLILTIGVRIPISELQYQTVPSKPMQCTSTNKNSAVISGVFAFKVGFDETNLNHYGFPIHSGSNTFFFTFWYILDILNIEIYQDFII